MKKHILACLSILIIISTGCQKDKDQFVAYPLDGQVATLIDGILEQPESFLMSPNITSFFQIDKTFSLVVDAESFKDVTADNFTLDWTNGRNAIQMELHDLPNYCNGSYLSSTFAFNIESNDEVSINKDKPLQVFVESDLVEDQVLFFMTNEGWIELDASNMVVAEWADENDVPKSGFKVAMDNFGWYTIASKIYLTQGVVGNFCINMEGQYTQTNSRSLVILDNNIVIPMIRSLNQGLFCTTMDIPVGQTIRSITMSSLREGAYEFYHQASEMENGLIIEPTMEDKTIEEIKRILEDI